jgi:hypothetical protein
MAEALTSAERVSPVRHASAETARRSEARVTLRYARSTAVWRSADADANRVAPGANVEAKGSAEHAFERPDCMRVEFKTDASNERSRRALAALPAEFEGIFRKHMLAGNDRDRLRDSAWYAIVDDDWPAVKANLERRLTPRT